MLKEHFGICRNTRNILTCISILQGTGCSTNFAKTQECPRQCKWKSAWPAPVLQDETGSNFVIASVMQCWAVALFSPPDLGNVHGHDESHELLNAGVDATSLFHLWDFESVTSLNWCITECEDKIKARLCVHVCTVWTCIRICRQSMHLEPLNPQNLFGMVVLDATISQCSVPSRMPSPGFASLGRPKARPNAIKAYTYKACFNFHQFQAAQTHALNWQVPVCVYMRVYGCVARLRVLSWLRTETDEAWRSLDTILNWRASSGLRTEASRRFQIRSDSFSRCFLHKYDEVQAQHWQWSRSCRQ